MSIYDDAHRESRHDYLWRDRSDDSDRDDGTADFFAKYPYAVTKARQTGAMTGIARELVDRDFDQRVDRGEYDRSYDDREYEGEWLERQDARDGR